MHEGLSLPLMDMPESDDDDGTLPPIPANALCSRTPLYILLALLALTPDTVVHVRVVRAHDARAQASLTDSVLCCHQLHVLAGWWQLLWQQ